MGRYFFTEVPQYCGAYGEPQRERLPPSELGQLVPHICQQCGGREINHVLIARQGTHDDMDLTDFRGSLDVDRLGRHHPLQVNGSTFDAASIGSKSPLDIQEVEPSPLAVLAPIELDEALHTLSGVTVDLHEGRDDLLFRRVAAVSRPLGPNLADFLPRRSIPGHGHRTNATVVPVPRAVCEAQPPQVPPGIRQPHDDAAAIFVFIARQERGDCTIVIPALVDSSKMLGQAAAPTELLGNTGDSIAEARRGEGLAMPQQGLPLLSGQ
mmetsp:Transcript_43322/g.125228  ORF Transcript_43322/g.125228 Transcript_43322/m.125228 type:complete len:267 (+) Transcript_43322:661-1461(+)